MGVLILIVAPILAGIRLLQGRDAKSITQVIASGKFICLYILYVIGKVLYYYTLAGDELTSDQKSTVTLNIVIQVLELGFWVCGVILLSKKDTIDAYARWCESRSQSVGNKPPESQVPSAGGV